MRRYLSGYILWGTWHSHHSKEDIIWHQEVCVAAGIHLSKLEEDSIQLQLWPGNSQLHDALPFPVTHQLPEEKPHSSNTSCPPKQRHEVEIKGSNRWVYGWEFTSKPWPRLSPPSLRFIVNEKFKFPRPSVVKKTLSSVRIWRFLKS